MSLTRLLALPALLAVISWLPGAADAEEPRDGEHVEVAIGDAFAGQREAILEEMHSGGRYAEITPEAREEVLQSLQAMAEVLEGRARIADLTPEERVLVFNAQGVVNTHLTFAAEQSREECRRERKVGTHFRTTICNTVAEWTRQLEDAQQEMNLKQRGPRCTQQNPLPTCSG